MDEKKLITKKGYDALIDELNQRKTVIRSKIADAIEMARQQGDLSENSAYKASMEDKEYNETKIVQIENEIKNLSIIKYTKSSSANLGRRVIVTDIKNDTKKEFFIVGQNEANPSEGKISIESPIGKQLLNKNVGDIVVIEMPNQKIEYKILDIN